MRIAAVFCQAFFPFSSCCIFGSPICHEWPKVNLRSKIIRVGHEEQGSLELRRKVSCPNRVREFQSRFRISDFRILTTALCALHGEL